MAVVEPGDGQKSEFAFVLRMPAVRASINELTRHRVHPQFAGYLALKWQSARVGSDADLSSPFRTFFDTFLSVAGTDLYLRPFWHENTTSPPIWMNKNLAGSFAPSSLRGRGSPFSKVVDVVGTRSQIRYSLRLSHWELVREHLMLGVRLPIVPLAVMLYRDFSINPTTHPSLSDLINVFRFEFGYDSAPGQHGNSDEFDCLYSTDLDERSVTDWFEPWHSAPVEE
jgi:hypothetical protein